MLTGDCSEKGTWNNMLFESIINQVAHFTVLINGVEWATWLPTG